MIWLKIDVENLKFESESTMLLKLRSLGVAVWKLL